jgi:hypothetical protein
MSSFKSGFLKYCKSSIAPQDTGAYGANNKMSHHPVMPAKHLNDPVRISDRPDVVGQFFDPMSIGSQQSTMVGTDVTDTGA